jgi:pyridinium-3,5-biscarboxylic acid mononucleotide sulfurtransferase
MGDIDALRRDLARRGSVVVAFSGGADSSLLAFVANEVLGPHGAVVVTAVSASLARSELDDCRALAQEWGLNYREVQSHEADRPGYVANGRDRCWYCKDELMRCLAPVASAFGGGGAETEDAQRAGSAHIALGVNLDDLCDHRPGQLAAREAGAIFPLVEAGFTKEDVREMSRFLGLRTWDKPAAACLASRLPYGTPVSLGVLGAVESAEAGLAALGFRASRVRHYGELARIELPLVDIERAVACRDQIVRAVQAAGYRYVTLDMEGLRSGNLNGASAPNKPVRAEEMAI